MIKTINIPINLIRGYKRVKNSLEMLACAIFIKSRFQNSCFYDLKITSVIELFGVSFKKAQKLLESLREHELFVYNERKNCVFAKSFKSEDTKRYGRHKKYNAKADYCRKLQVSDGMTLRELVRELRNTLLMNVIHASGQDGFIVSENKKAATKPNVQRAIPQRKFAESFGMSKSSASRYINKLVEDKRVSKTEIVAECVINELNEKTESDYRMTHTSIPHYKVWHNTKSGGWSAWVVYGRVYSILDRNIEESFKNVIFNYRYPMVIEPKTSAEIDGKWHY